MFIKLTRRYTEEPVIIGVNHIMSIKDYEIVMNTQVKGYVHISVRETADEIVNKIGGMSNGNY